jgi:thiol-disulfide isomerase/thioredoxin
MNINKEHENAESPRSRFRKGMIEWVVIGLVAAILYLTGLHVAVIGTMQRALLLTGIFNAKVDVEAMEGPFLADADYNFTFITNDGETVRLSDFRGDVVFVNVWASWCPPCVAEMPTIDKLHNDLRSRGHENIRFLMLSVDEEPERANRFMERRNYNLPWHFPASPLPAALRGTVLPTTWVISRDGQVVYRREGIADYGTHTFRNWMIGLNEKPL